MINHISIAIIVKNGGKTFRKVLDSVRGFSDVVVYDNGSTDNTKEIAKNYTNVNLIEGDFLGFGKTKNKAAEYCQNKWVLSLDADEVVDDELLSEFKKIKLEERKVYVLQRISFYKGKKIRYSGWGIDKIPRLYHVEKTCYNDDLIHEKIITKNIEEIIINGFIEHYSFLNAGDFLKKMDKYSDEFARQNQGKKRSSPTKAVFRALFSFFRNYIFKFGFLDGYPGLLISVSSAGGVFYKYIKLYELNKAKS